MADFEPRDLVTTREAAAILGVGTTSIKRWADRGQLACVRTAGGHRRFSRAVVLAFGWSGQTQGASDRVPADDGWIDEWIALLVAGEGAEKVEDALARERERRESWAAVADALGAVVDALGQRWAAGALSVVEEHLASARLARAAAHLTRGPSQPGAPRALLAAAQSDDHSLGLSLCELVLRELGWTTLWIGVRAPTVELCGFIARRCPQLVVMSASAYATDGALLAAQAERVGEACRRVGSELALGGRGHWPKALAHGHRLHEFRELSALIARDEPSGPTRAVETG